MKVGWGGYFFIVLNFNNMGKQMTTLKKNRQIQQKSYKLYGFSV